MLSETKVVNKYKEPFDEYIGRGSLYGNPFSHKEGTKAVYKVETREEAIEKYREWVVQQPDIMSSLKKLRDKTLGCFCKPKPCHGDVLVELIKEDYMFDILKKEPIEIWTDGSSSNNKTRCAGYGTILKYKDHYKEFWGGFEPDTTNQQTEVYSCLVGLQQIKTNDIPIKIHSDSAYLINCMTQDWINKKWRMNGWTNSTGESVANQELWEELDRLVKKQTYIEWLKVKGHQGIPLNERADDISVRGRHDIEVQLGLRESKKENQCDCKICKKIEIASSGVFGKFPFAK